MKERVNKWEKIFSLIASKQHIKLRTKPKEINMVSLALNKKKTIEVALISSKSIPRL